MNVQMTALLRACRQGTYYAESCLRAGIVVLCQNLHRIFVLIVCCPRFDSLLIRMRWLLSTLSMEFRFLAGDPAFVFDATEGSICMFLVEAVKGSRRMFHVEPVDGSACVFLVIPVDGSACIFLVEPVEGPAACFSYRSPT